MIMKLPLWLKPQDSQFNAQFYILKSGTSLYSSPISQSNPGSTLRGKAISLLILDEIAHIRYIEEAWTGMAPALSKAQKTSETLGLPYGTVFLSTPNRTEGIGKFFFQNWQASINKEGLFKPHKIHWSEIPDFADDPLWYKKQCMILGNNKGRIQQELELKFIAASNSLFDETTQERLQTIKNTPLQKIRIIGGAGSEIHRFGTIDPNKFYMIGVDTAGEFGDDYSAVEVFDFVDMKQVLEFRAKDIPVIKFTEVVQIIARLVPRNILVVENNGLGNQVSEALYFNENFAYNMYGEYKGREKKEFKAGITTTTKNRPLILDSLYNYVNADPGMVKSEPLALELIGLVDKKNKIQADTGSHDDLAMALGFICYVRHYQKAVLGASEDLIDSTFLAGEETMLQENVVNDILNLNLKDIPLVASYRTKSYKNFKRDLEKHIKQNVGKSLSGNVNINNIWKKSGSIFDV